MTKLRLIVDAYNQLKQDDPDTAITLSALRRMVKAGDIPAVRVGRKSLVNYDLLLQYLYTGSHAVGAKEPDVLGEIRKIS